ncbi:molybdopterin molybdotransferase MoeA [Halorubrum lacusprofundi]|jgi:molybdopterin molybdotransferase|uniref:Molybdenum cofactor synthesis domain protein n=1 Tax=Halorubrum lacusprofundi (strain ATCC 49239 / DSM 5036 / JCM 8891 / ACAM 34) TaxID=416348 RepID=B9LR45_HALLT|nr:gephyrin-like molybdotransferase Glp [Halorubrum lacusprofundi]ACM57699.1 molybdenum cofactor synthesis domain protein [Halorubrum lacusprofundi ATCC 49239]MCG1005704.1 molybdopterin molybdotransferase MoeA [Halorubrum lacusprofundi]
MSHDRREAGFKRRTRVADALATLLDAAEPHGRTESAPLADADGRVVAEPIDAPAPVPSYDRAAMDGYAVRAEDTFGASDRSPAVLRAVGTEADSIAPGEAARVHTGSAVPEGADAVVMIEQVETVADEVEAFDAVAEGENVGEAGEDVADGQRLFEAGHVLRPSDLGLLKSVGLDAAPVYERSTIAVIPTGEELVQSDPGPGEVIETNGLTVSRLVERWGGEARYRDVVTDDEDALSAAIEADLDADVVVTTGGSSVGERDLLPEVIDSIGEVLVHGVALKPGHPVCLGVVDDTPIVSLPGYPVACIVNAAQFLRPLQKHVGGTTANPFPTRRATLTRKVPSEPGTRTFARVSVEGTGEGGDGDGDDSALPAATPTRASGSGILSSVALADGWVVVPEPREGLDAGEIVDVELWEASQ